MTCSVSMLLLFAVAVLYLNENYSSISISPIVRMVTPSLSSSFSSTTSTTHFVPYLHPLAYHSLAYGTCPYTNPAFPSIGPDLSSICPSNKPMRAGVAWYFDKHIRRNIAKDDTQSTTNLDSFFNEYERFKDMVRNNTNSSDKALEISFKKPTGLHLEYQYLSCQTKQDIVALYQHWDEIVNHEQMTEILSSSWKNLKVCFDRVLCMNDNPHGGYSFNLYLDERSQDVMRQLVSKTEEIEESEYGVELTYKRVAHQQAFHVTLTSITNMHDYDAFDAKRLMERINEEIKSWPCIRLSVPPPFKPEMCYNTKMLQEKHPKFVWKCAEIE